MPSDVPEPEGGSLVSVMESSDESGSYWTVMYEDATSSDVDDYAQELESSGWTRSSSGNYDGLRMEEWNSGNLSILFSYSSDDNNLTLAVGEEL